MDKKIKSLIEKLSNSKEIDFSKECVHSVKNEEIILHEEVILKQEDALRFYKEKYQMQQYLDKEKRLKGLGNLIIKLGELELNTYIKSINISTANFSYLLFEIDKQHLLLGIVKGSDNLEAVKKYIEVLRDRKKTVSLSFNYYRYKKCELVEHISSASPRWS